MNTEELELLKERSLLTLIFDEDELEHIISQGTIQVCENGQMIIKEGNESDELVIPISGQVELFSMLGDELVINGRVQPGRTINTYSLLREVPYQYSARFSENGSIIRFPAALIREVLSKKTALKSYLLGMTESQDIRTLSKELESLGTSKEFKIDLIASLVCKSFAPQEWLLHPGETPREAIYLVEGQLISQKAVSDSSKSILQIQVPARSWQAWANLAEKKESKYLIKSISAAKVLSLSSADFFKLRESFPEDFDLYHQSIISGKQTLEEDEDTNEELDIEDLIQQAGAPKRKLWQALPWIQQNDQMDCGPACMAMISAYYNHKVPIQYWRSQLSTNQEGTSLFDLAFTAERNGFTSCALNCEDLSELDKDFFPAIALRQYHYLVVYSVSKKWVTVGDPALGIVKMKSQDFYKGFENCLLFLKPNESFFDLTVPTGQYGHYLSLLNGLGREMLLSFSVSVLMVLLGLFQPILSQIFLDDILVNRDMDLLKIVLIASVVMTLLLGFLGWARAYYSNYLAVKFSYKANSVFMKKMLSLNYKFFADRHVGDFTKRLDEMNKIKNFLLKSVEDVIISSLSVVIYTLALFVYSPTVAMTFFILVPVFFVISWVSGKKLTGIYQEIFREGAEIGSNLTDTIKAVSTVKTMTGELACRWRYEEKLIKLLSAEKRFALTAAGISVFSNFYTSLVNFSLMGLCGYLAIKGDLTPGQVVAVTMISGNILGPLLRLAGKIAEVQEIKAAMGRINDILLAPGEASSKGRVRKDNLRGEIEFKDVWFKYGGEGSDWVLKGITFKIEAGQNVAFVGPSGSGKSTIAALLSRMFVPTKGQIFIDGRDYLDYDIAWLRTQLGILHQESHLFHGTILENIVFSDPNIDLARAVDAAKRAAADEFIQKKPNDYYYMISAGGFGLSGGEKQRISVARTLYRDPRILILDEATSALDGIAEKSLLDNLKSNSKVCTTINIAHRYSTVKHSDFALVLFEGRVVGFGTHEDLITENEVYRGLFGFDVDLEDVEGPPALNLLVLGQGVA